MLLTSLCLLLPELAAVVRLVEAVVRELVSTVEPVRAEARLQRSELELQTINRRSCTTTEKARTSRAFCWLKAATTAFTFKNLL